MRFGLSNLALVSLLAGSCTHAPWKPHHGWRALAVGEVVMYTDTVLEHEATLRTTVVSAGVFAETFFKSFDRPGKLEVLYLEGVDTTPLLRLPGHGAKNDHYLTLIGCQSEKAKATPLVIVGPSGGHVPHGSIGNPEDRIRNASRHPTHQVAHAYIETAVPGAPVWFHEGFARYLSRFHTIRQGPRDVACFGPLGVTRAPMPIAQLFDIAWDQFHVKQNDWVLDTGEVIVHFLLHGEKDAHRQRFLPFMKALASGLDTRAAFAAVYPEMDLDKLDKRIQDHATTRRPRPWDTVCAMGFPLGFPPDNLPEPYVYEAEEPMIKGLFTRLNSDMSRHRGWADYVPECPSASGDQTTTSRRRENSSDSGAPATDSP